MNFLNTRRAACACLLAYATLPAHAGRPMTVDDAAIVDPGQCQLETYALRADEVREFWATPACNVGGTWELAAGGAWMEDNRRTMHYGRLQAKTVFKTLDPGGWGIGLVLANQFRSGRGLDGDLSANMPLSFSLRDDSVLLHLNAGVVRMQSRRRTDASWGIGAEFKLSERNSLTAETFGRQRSGSRYQVGFAHALIPDHLQIDATWGSRMARGASEPVVTLGLVLQTN
ncbi:hypothetical protein GTP46_07645 [Duganella sp. FT135W]|uniref:Outer membrane beta-barrel protein n=1 Tax=Duganella flavida TaxID=2692175 RepID=A0A6L8K9M2_9BURK|nr:hypothetical protein [Duganella flavida]MYM22514.1 hypothetical protein [Duganella flavida]